MKRGEEEAARTRARAPEWIVLTPEKLSAAAVKMVEPMRTCVVGVRVDTPRARHGIEESREDEKDDDVNEAGEEEESVEEPVEQTKLEAEAR